MVRWTAFALCLAFTSLPARAVVVALSNDAMYTQVPASNDFGFANVGTVHNSIAGFPASGVYLGDGWVITAFHNVTIDHSTFAFGPVTFGGLPYAADPSTATRLHNPNNSLADLAIFRLTSEPPLLGASLSGSTPNQNTAVRMMGNGVDRELNETGWDVNGGVWTEVGTGGAVLGYDLIGARSMRWGTNTVQPNALTPVDQGFGSVLTFQLDFDRVAGEGMATTGDSGGGVFVKSANAWQLAGVMVAAGAFNGQPAASVSYGFNGNGNVTYVADIATYKNEIDTIMASVPEPSSVALLLTSLVFLPRRRASRQP